MAPRAVLFARVACTILLVSGADAFRPGDHIHALKREQHEGWRTEWHEVRHSQQPRFDEDATVVLELPAHKSRSALADLRLSFSFSESRFVVPYQTVFRHAERLDLLQLTFYHRGGDIVRVAHDAEYVADAGHGALGPAGAVPLDRPPPRVLLRYHWRALPDVDADAGLHFLVAACSVLSLLLMFAVFLDPKLDDDLSNRYNGEPEGVRDWTPEREAARARKRAARTGAGDDHYAGAPELYGRRQF